MGTNDSLPRRGSRWLVLTAVFWIGLGSSGSAQTYNTMIQNGASSNRVDMIFIGDGYLSSQLNTTYVSHINSTLNHFFQQPLGQPLGRYQRFFNVHRVNVASNQEGADKPPLGIFVDTALDASYWTGGTERCLYFNTTKANNAVATALSGSGIDTNDGMLLGVVNDSKYGGCGGQWGVYAGANSLAREIALHEIGHSFANLADEYFTNGTTYTGGEPEQWNITRTPTTGKWNRWVGYVDPDNPALGPIGYFEGGGYNQFGLYRPSDNSKMRSLDRPFDAISREKFIHDIYEEVDPLDGWLGNSGTLTDPATLWVDTVDPDVIAVEWFLDGQSTGLFGENLDWSGLGLAAGSYTLTARAYDRILDHSFTGDGLDWWRLDDAHLSQSVSWSIVSTVPEGGALPLLGLTLAWLLRSRKRRECPAI